MNRRIASSPRHEMEIHVRLGADAEGTIKAIDVYTLSNTGAYGEHGPTTVGLSAINPFRLPDSGSVPVPLRCGSIRMSCPPVLTADGDDTGNICSGISG